MKCILIKDGKGPADNLYFGEEPIPVPEKGQVLVKVKVSVRAGGIWTFSNNERSRRNGTAVPRPMPPHSLAYPAPDFRPQPHGHCPA